MLVDGQVQKISELSSQLHKALQVCVTYWRTYISNLYIDCMFLSCMNNSILMYLNIIPTLSLSLFLSLCV